MFKKEITEISSVNPIKKATLFKGVALINEGFEFYSTVISSINNHAFLPEPG